MFKLKYLQILLIRMNREKGASYYEDMKEIVSLKTLQNVCFNEKKY